MNILLTVHQFFPDFYSGTEVLTLETAKELLRLGHTVSVFTGFPGKRDVPDSGRFDRYAYEGIEVHRFHHAPVPMGRQSNIVESEYNNRLFADYFREFLAALNPDVVHFFHLARLSGSAIDICSELRVPMVMTPTDFWLVCFMHQLRMTGNSLCSGPDQNRVNCLRHMVERTQPRSIRSVIGHIPDRLLASVLSLVRHKIFSRVFFFDYVHALTNRPDFLRERMNKVDRMIVPTRFMEKILKDNGLEADRVAYSPFGIKLDRISRQVRTGLGDKLRIGFIGHLDEHKGAHLLVDAVRALPSGEPVELSVYGREDEYPEYAARLRQAAGNDSRIRFCGTFPNERTGEVLASFDVLAVPSIWYENSPLVIYSAQAAGCPVIASDLPGISEVIRHDKNGLLFQPGDIPGISTAIKRLRNEGGLLERLSGNSLIPKSISDYTAELLELYREVSKKR